jgi:hypothetical protein
LTENPAEPALAMLRADVILREVQGEGVLIDLATGDMFGLDAVSLRVWQAVTECSAVEVAARRLLAGFEGTDIESLRADIEVFLGDLAQAGLLAGSNAS